MHSKSYLLDFDQRARAMRLPSQHISKERVLAMFYNNKGADHLIKKEYQQAYAYFRTSLETDSRLIESWTNLGTLYSRLGKNQYAEATYNKALTIKHSDPTILENLSHIYSLTGRHDAAKKIQAKIKSQRRDNPYYHYMLGEVEFEMKNWHIAIDHFKDSIRLDHKQHQFYFSMAKSYYHLGDMDKSEKYLQLAKRYTPSDRLEAKYQGKLNLLHTL